VFDELNLDLVTNAPNAIKSPKQKEEPAEEIDEDALLLGRYQSLGQ
jgi:hypothetical protein